MPLWSRPGAALSTPRLGPLLDRIDCTLNCQPSSIGTVASERAEETSAAIRERMGRARQRQQERFRSDAKVIAMLGWARACLSNTANSLRIRQDLIRVAMNELNLSAALTIAS